MRTMRPYPVSATSKKLLIAENDKSVVSGACNVCTPLPALKVQQTFLSPFISLLAGQSICKALFSRVGTHGHDFFHHTDR